jgi:hypothetical protein
MSRTICRTLPNKFEFLKTPGIFNEKSICIKLNEMTSFDELRFRHKVDSALGKVRQILESNRNPVYASDVHHRYEDKYGVTEMMVMMALASVTQILGVLGFSSEHMKTIAEWSSSKCVSLRLKAEEKTTLVREVVREDESAERTEAKAQLAGLEASWSGKVLTKVTEYVWGFEGNYELMAIRGVGSDASDRMVICRRSCSHEIETGTKSTPRPAAKVYPDIDVDVSWIFRHVNSNELGAVFKIARESEKCRTPRRNPDVEDALRNLRALSKWGASVCRYFSTGLFSAWVDHGLDVRGITAQGVFVPVLPLLEGSAQQDEMHGELRAVEEGGREAAGDDEAGAVVASDDGASGSVALKAADVNAFLAEQLRSLNERVAAVKATLPSGDSGKVISAAEAQVMVCLQHTADVCERLQDGVDYVEDMLRNQLLSAVGRDLTAADFSSYARHHNRKLFRAGFEPQPFCYSVRRSAQHSPEGHISIEEQQADGSMSEPVFTMVSRAAASAEMRFAINAATTVRFGGERCLHAWLRHTFSGMASASAFMSAQARQFSSFVVLVGRISSATTFEPKHGVIVQNKDDLRIPLVLEAIPSPKDFRDAIESLSPEQRAFARAIRAMQLESTLFGVLVVQIKPQLERLLRLPPESLTKEIRLTQDLTELFLKYQIPADLLTAGPVVAAGDEAAGAGAGVGADKVEEVKAHVRAMKELIGAAKQTELREAAQGGLFGAFSEPQAVNVGFGFGGSPAQAQSSQSAFGFGPNFVGGGFGGFGFVGSAPTKSAFCFGTPAPVEPPLVSAFSFGAGGGIQGAALSPTVAAPEFAGSAGPPACGGGKNSFGRAITGALAAQFQAGFSFSAGDGGDGGPPPSAAEPASLGFPTSTYKSHARSGTMKRGMRAPSGPPEPTKRLRLEEVETSRSPPLAPGAASATQGEKAMPEAAKEKPAAVDGASASTPAAAFAADPSASDAVAAARDEADSDEMDVADESAEAMGACEVDYTQLPGKLDKRCEARRRADSRTC